MKNLGWLLAFLFASICHLPAQVTVEVTLEQDQFLPGETLVAAVRVTNRSGRTLHLGQEDWLRFNVEARNGSVVSKIGVVPVTGEFTLDSSKRAIKRVDLAPYFNLIRAEHYSITATVNLQDWREQIVSAPKPFDIIQGAKLWEQNVGIPKAEGTPEVRKYILQQANYLKKGLMLYFRLSDSNGKPIKVFPIGPILSFGQPDKEVDKQSNLHVLYQDTPHAFDYTVFNPDGELILHQKYDYTPTRPVLKTDGAGSFYVAGGTRRITVADIPAPLTNQSNARTTP